MNRSWSVSRGKHETGQRSARSRARLRRRTAEVASVALAVGGLLIAAATTSTAADTNVNAVFELDGNIADNSATPPPDWANFFTTGSLTDPPTTVSSSLQNGFVNAKFFRDFTPGSTADTTTYATGSKDTLPITGGWQCKKSNNVTDKGDIQNTYMAAYRDPTNNHLVIFAGLEKNAPNGNNNMAVWLLHDGTVNCDGATGGNVNFTGHHVDGDLLLVAAFLNGGSNPQVSAYKWSGDDTGSLNSTPLDSGGKCEPTGSQTLCAITNDTSGLTGIPWYTSDKNLGTGHALGADQFFEMGADITALGLNECFANYLANTRSSQELGATLYDFAGGQAPTCGSLTVDKYIDANMNGARDTATGSTDVISGAPVAGWSFTITGPNGFSCTGTTTSSAGALGTVDCTASTSTTDKARTDLTNLLPGSYTVTETQKSHYFNTDPGPLDDASILPAKVYGTSTASKTFTMGTTNQTVHLGNTCFVNKTFEITGVPTGTSAPSSITAEWSIGKGHYGGNATSGTVSLAATSDSTKWSGALNDVFTQDSVISWDWYINGDTAHKVTGGTSETVGHGYPTCAATNTDSFPLSSIEGMKYKDVSNFGVLNTTGDNPDVVQSGFEFKLYAGTIEAGETALQTATSGADGKYSFSNVAPGTYTIRETHPTGWLQTLPTSNGDRTVTVTLNQTTATVDPFLNTPLSNIGVTFTPLAKTPPGGTTDATKATIACTDASSNSVGSQTGNSLSATNLKIGVYTCTVTITDP